MAKPLIKAPASENSLAGRPRCRTTCNWENNFLRGNPPASRLPPTPRLDAPCDAAKKQPDPLSDQHQDLGSQQSSSLHGGQLPSHVPEDSSQDTVQRMAETLAMEGWDGVGTACARGRVLDRPTCALRCPLSAAGTAAEPAPGRRLGFSPMLAAPR